MKTIIEILMKRDGITEKDARAMVEDAKSELYDAFAGTSCLSVEDVMIGELGLEPEYAMYLL